VNGCEDLREVRLNAPTARRVSLNALSLQRLEVDCVLAVELSLWNGSLPAQSGDMRLRLPSLRVLDISGWKYVPEVLQVALSHTGVSSLV
jgi:hypothetical protein